jgi:hypothetical protein
MNYPTSDVQFLAQMLIRVRAADQISSAETRRLEQLADRGHTSVPSVELPDEPDVNFSEATRAPNQL